MSRPSAAAVELDFFGLGKMNSQQRDTTTLASSAAAATPKSQFQKFLERGRSFRGHQSSSSGGGAVSREAMMMPNLFSPEVLKSVIVAGKSVPEKQKAKPMTVFYGGHVSVYDVTHDQFESIVNLAMDQGRLESARVAGDRPQEAKQQLQMVNLGDSLNEDLPIARRKSLQRFLEKRKERLNTSSPYACHY